MTNLVNTSEAAARLSAKMHEQGKTFMPPVIQESLYRAFSKRTNFDRITESPEKLAQFLHESFSYCINCPMFRTCDNSPEEMNCEQVMLAWLQEKCDV